MAAQPSAANSNHAPIISGVEKVNFGTKHQKLGTERTVSGNTGKIMIEYINQKVL